MWPRRRAQAASMKAYTRTSRQPLHAPRRGHFFPRHVCSTASASMSPCSLEAVGLTGRSENVKEVPWEENPQPWKKVPTPWKKVSTAACFYGPPPRRKQMLRKKVYVRREFFYVLREFFYVASPFSIPRPAKNSCREEKTSSSAIFSSRHPVFPVDFGDKNTCFQKNAYFCSLMPTPSMCC